MLNIYLQAYMSNTLLTLCMCECAVCVCVLCTTYAWTVLVGETNSTSLVC